MSDFSHDFMFIGFELGLRSVTQLQKEITGSDST